MVIQKFKTKSPKKTRSVHEDSKQGGRRKEDTSG